MRRDELITQFKQRVAIPGGTCSFDLPAFHYWLQKEPDDRAAQIRRWGEDLEIINDAVSHILRMLRDSTEPTLVQATSGFYQQQIDPSYQCQLIRVFISDNLDTFPEISGGKHRFSVRFLRQTDTLQRPEQIDENVSFEVQCCSI